MSDENHTSEAGAADDLPPVTEPSADFLLQLFIVPAVIVVIIVMIWLMFNWLAHKGGDPDSYIQALERNNPARWQVAHTVADELRVQGNPLRSDDEFAAKLAALLRRELESGRADDEEDQRLREYLCRALGEFEVDTGLEVLLETARADGLSHHESTRLAALESVAVLMSNVDQLAPEQRAAVLAVLDAASREEDALVRYRAAFALGILGGDEAVALLERLVEDTASAHVRYNAAAALARHGDPAATEVLSEMLDPDQIVISSTGQDVTEQERSVQRQIILVTALEAVGQFSAASSSAVPTELVDAVRRLSENQEVGRAVQFKAKDVLASIGDPRQASIIPFARPALQTV